MVWRAANVLGLFGFVELAEGTPSCQKVNVTGVARSEGRPQEIAGGTDVQGVPHQ